MSTSTTFDRTAFAAADVMEQRLREWKRLEWILFAVRWFYLPAIMIAFLVDNISRTIIWVLIIGVITTNTLVPALNQRIDNLRDQRRFGLALLLADSALIWGTILLFIGDTYTSAYAAYTLVIIEAAIRYGMPGSLTAYGVFVAGFLAEWIYRYDQLGIPFLAGGFVFWLTTMLLISVMQGMMIRGLRNARQQSEMLAVERVQLLERRRLSHELHDSVLKSLQGIALEAHVMGRTDNPRDFAERASYIEEVCQRMSQEIRESVFELRTEDTQEGIASKLSAVVDRWSQKSGIKSDFEFSGRDTTLPATTSYNLRRILGEALTNIEKHSRATHVGVNLTIDSKQLGLSVADNGNGFNTRDNALSVFTAKGKLGLTAMKERAELVGGDFHIDSGNDGTCLRVSVPLVNLEKPKEKIVAPDIDPHR